VRTGLTVPGEAGYRELLDLAVEVALEAADLVRRRRSGGVEVSDTKSSPVDIVTEVDKAAEQLIFERLLGARPDDGFLGEEGASAESRSGVTWIVDPIDGTVNFVYGIPSYAVSIAAATAGEVVAGVVVNVHSGERFTATRGGGAFLDGAPLVVADASAKPLSQRLVGTGFHYVADIKILRSRPCCVRSVTSVASARRPWTCALSPAVGSTPTSRRGSTRGTWPPEGLWRPRPVRRSRHGSGAAATTASSAPPRPVSRSSATSCGGAASWGNRGAAGTVDAAARPGTRRGRGRRRSGDTMRDAGARRRSDGAQSASHHTDDRPTRPTPHRAHAGGQEKDMATDYDAPRKNEEDQSEESLEELKARRHDKNSGKVDEDEAEAAESFELPGADLSHEELAVEVRPRQEDEFTCMSCFLVHHRSQLADAKRLICKDCA
jgi:fructose-1,6-bisphosphatase/inositol monophosphatase family enzyme